ncbi:MAG: hypothetical protein JW801_17955 [Bacteroidales bacterium]|nr:hypothetical protein [Bacteroidales bacterium]
MDAESLLKILVDILGWVGSALILIAYFLISRHRVDSRSKVYQIFNLLGSFFLIGNTLYYQTYSVVALNTIWLFIGISSLLRNQKASS